MSVYDCEPPQLDCDIPPPDEEVGKRRENDFDLDDLEFSSFPMNLNEQHTLSNALHLYNSSPPPVDDFFIDTNDEYLDTLDIPPDEISENTEKSTNEEHSDPIDIPEIHAATPPPLENDVDIKSITSDEKVEQSMKKVDEDKSDTKELPEFPNSDPKTVDSSELNVTNFTLEDLPENEEEEGSSQCLAADDFVSQIHKSHVEEPIVNDDMDDDFDEFSNFEQAIPIDRRIEQKEIKFEENVTSEIPFEADFSGFEANFDNEFQAFSAEEGQVKSSETNVVSGTVDDEIDDDFGDFNDFTQAPTVETPSLEMPKEFEFTHTCTPLAILNDTEVKTILSEMFPSDQQVTADESTKSDSITRKESDVKIVKDVDSTLALSYDYKDSTTNHILIKALGIDERNILFGAQWSSNMPRFASDLSFNPLEPSKFASASSSSLKNSNSVVHVNNNSSITSCKAKEIESEKVQQPDIVPQFDWNVAGLINPLDGKQANPLKTIERDEPPLTYDLSVFDSTPQKSSDVLSPDVEGLSNKHVWQTERFDMTNTVVRERTIKLPETHIFTPIKSISPVAREVSRETSPIEHEKEKRSTTIKEYHDIEYSLESPKKVDDFGDFNDFQSATTTTIPANPFPAAIMSTLEPTILAPQKVIETKTHEPPPTVNSAVIDDFESFIKNVPNEANQTSQKFDVFAELSKKPSMPMPDDSIEDDFADFQAAPTIDVLKQQPAPPLEKQSYKNDSSITLSPSRLVGSMQKMPEPQTTFTSSWMNDVLDSDEISRIEAAFPKCKVDSNKRKQTVEVNSAVKQEEDEWCDFQSVSQSSNVITSSQNNSTVPNQSSSASDASDQWSDFVSVPIVKPSINTSQFLSKPNFSSWNQSVGKPYVNHTTSFLSSSNNYPNSHFDESFYSSMSDSKRQPMTITNNFNYNNFERQDISTATNLPPYQMSNNGISTILPDLQFALPKTLVNLSRGNGSDTTKK